MSLFKELDWLWRLRWQKGSCERVSVPLSQPHWRGAVQSLGGVGQPARLLCPFPVPGDLPDPGVDPASPALAGEFFTTEPPGKPCCGECGAAINRTFWQLPFSFPFYPVCIVIHTDLRTLQLELTATNIREYLLEKGDSLVERIVILEQTHLGSLFCLVLNSSVSLVGQASLSPDPVSWPFTWRWLHLPTRFMK